MIVYNICYRTTGLHAEKKTDTKGKKCSHESFNTRFYRKLLVCKSNAAGEDSPELQKVKDSPPDRMERCSPIERFLRKQY